MNTKIIGIITTKNRPEFLEHAIESAVNQSRPLDKLIISSDSDDPSAITQERKLAERYNVSYLSNYHAHNCSGVRNNAILTYITENTRSISSFGNTYVAFLDDDDRWDYIYIEKCYEHTVTLPDFVIAGLVYQNDINSTKLSIPQTLHIDDFLRGNPHIQGSNMFVKLTMLLKCGLFDENMSSSVDRDIFIRIMLLTPQYKVINEHLVYIDACNNRERVTNSRELKLRDLSIFFQKYANIMSDDIKHDFFSRIKFLFGIEYNDIVKGPTQSHIEIINNPPIFTNSHITSIGKRLIIGVVISNIDLGVRLINDITCLGNENIKLVIVKNYKGEKEILNYMLDDAGFDYRIYDCNETIREISTTRNILFQTLYAESNDNDVFWILDDDMQLAYLSNRGDIVKTDIFKVINDYKDKYDAIVGDYTLDPPLPILSTVRTKLLDYVYYHKLKYKGNIELHDLRDYYYDLSESTCEHLETPFTINPKTSLKEIFSGKSTSRPLYLQHHEAVSASNCGGNVLIFNRNLLNIMHLSLTIAGNTGRRSDYFWVLESIRQNYCIKNIDFATLHNRNITEFRYEEEVNKLLRDMIGASCTKTISQIGICNNYDLLSNTYIQILYSRVARYIASYYRVIGLLTMLEDTIYSRYFTTSNLCNFISEINDLIDKNNLCNEWKILIDTVNNYE